MKNTLRSLREAAGLTQEGVARHFGITRSSVAQWERRKAPTAPEMGRLSDLAKLYGCTPTDLIGAINGDLSHGPRARTHDYHERPMSSGGGVPLIDWSNLGNLTRMPATSLADIPTLGYLPAPHTPPGSFALTVIGDAMVGPGRDSYADGEFVYIDPEGHPEHNSDVLVALAGGQHILRRLQITPEGRLLIALNPSYPNRILPMPADATIIGRVYFSGRMR